MLNKIEGDDLADRMHLYHIDTIPIPSPDIHHGRVNADFGQGFYLGPDADFTYRWARRDAVVNPCPCGSGKKYKKCCGR